MATPSVPADKESAPATAPTPTPTPAPPTETPQNQPAQRDDEDSDFDELDGTSTPQTFLWTCILTVTPQRS